MSKSISILTASVALALITACSPATETKTAKTQSTAPAAATQSAGMETKVKAVLLYADWCGSCKVLDPKIKAVSAGQSLKSVDFITLDYTDKNKENFYAQAAAAGVKAPLMELLGENVKTGMLVLVGVDDNKVVGKITKTMSEAEILASIKSAVSAS